MFNLFKKKPVKEVAKEIDGEIAYAFRDDNLHLSILGHNQKRWLLASSDIQGISFNEQPGKPHTCLLKVELFFHFYCNSLQETALRKLLCMKDDDFKPIETFLDTKETKKCQTKKK